MIRDLKDYTPRRSPDIPTADQVPYCPPHWWVIEEEWQHCRKCGEERPVHQVEAILEPEVERGVELDDLGDQSYATE